MGSAFLPTSLMHLPVIYSDSIQTSAGHGLGFSPRPEKLTITIEYLLR